VAQFGVVCGQLSMEVEKYDVTNCSKNGSYCEWVITKPLKTKQDGIGNQSKIVSSTLLRTKFLGKYKVA
jgi:hypothetical protein